MDKHKKTELATHAKSNSPEPDRSETEDDKSIPTVLSMSKEYPKYSNKIIIGIVSLILLVFLIGGYSLVNYITMPKWGYFKGGVHLVLEVESKGDTYTDEENTLKIADTLKNRIEKFGIRKKVIKPSSERNIIIQLPQIENKQRIFALITQSAFLEFKLVDDENNLVEALKGNIPPGREILYMVTRSSKTGETIKAPFLLQQRSSLTGKYLADAKVSINNQFNEPTILLTFNNQGARIFEKITGENINKRLAIVLDKHVYSAPKIMEKISGGKAQISGRFTMDQARDLAIVLGSHSYPAPVKIIEDKELTKELWMDDME